LGGCFFRFGRQPPFDNVADLKKDPLVMWPHRHIHLLAVLVSFVLPTLLGFAWDGWIGALGGFLIGGVAKIVVLQHCTFLINSACHTIGRQPYSTKCSARDSFLMAIFTFGEGYHNYHHEFQHDYRNGVKPWQWDPTKSLISKSANPILIRHATSSTRVVTRFTKVSRITGLRPACRNCARRSRNT